MKSGIIKRSLDIIIHFISGNTTHRKWIITGLSIWTEKQAVISLVHHTNMVKKISKSRHKQILMEWHDTEAKTIYLFHDCCCCWYTSSRQKSSELKQKQIIKIYHTIRSKYISSISVFQRKTTVAHGITDNTSDPTKMIP